MRVMSCDEVNWLANNQFYWGRWFTLEIIVFNQGLLLEEYAKNLPSLLSIRMPN